MEDKVFNELMATIKEVAEGNFKQHERVLGLIQELINKVIELQSKVAKLEAEKGRATVLNPDFRKF